MIGRETLSSIRDVVLETGHKATSYFRRRASRTRLAPVDARDRPIVEALESDGGFATSLDELGIDGSAGLLTTADQLFKEMELAPKKLGNKDYMISAPPDVISKYPDVIRRGLNERLLAIAENYIGMPVTYRGVLARLDMPDGTVRETRLWHLDQEDSRIVKIVVYVSDVGADGGPFEYLRASFRQPRQLARGPKKRVLDEAAFDGAVPLHHRAAVIGPRVRSASPIPAACSTEAGFLYRERGRACSSPITHAGRRVRAIAPRNLSSTSSETP